MLVWLVCTYTEHSHVATCQLVYGMRRWENLASSVSVTLLDCLHVLVALSFWRRVLSCSRAACLPQRAHTLQLANGKAHSL